MHHETSFAVWVSFVLFIFLVLALDLGVFHRKSHTVGFKESIIWSSVWIALAMMFSLIVLYWRGLDDFHLFLTGYVIEKSLSVDNLFVFLLIFNFLKIPSRYQHKVLFYGIIGALIMRAIFIWAGITVLERFHWIIYVFGAFLIYSGIRMILPQNEKQNLENSWFFKKTKKIFLTTHEFHDDKFFVKKDNAIVITPLFITLVFVEFSDVAFAIDSIPAIIGITHDPFLIFSSNVFAILGLRALYFCLKGFSDIFYYLKHGLSYILIFIGLKMLISHFYIVPIFVTMVFIFSVLIISVLVSLNKKRKDKSLRHRY